MLRAFRTLAVSLSALLTGLGAVAGAAPAGQGAPAVPSGAALSAPGGTPRAAGLAPPDQSVIQGIVAQQLFQLTGGPDAPTSSVLMGNVAGTDLGHMFSMNGKLYMVFGDTYGRGSDFPPDHGSQNEWRSNTMAVISNWPNLSVNPFHDPSTGMITDTLGHAKELLHSPHDRDGEGEITRIPTNGTAVEGRMFLHYMSVHDWLEPGNWTLNESRIAYSDDGGQNWTYAYWAWPGRSNFGQVAFVQDGGYIYLFGIPGGRTGGVKLARVPLTRNALLNPASYRYWDGGHNTWVTSEAQATLIVPGPVGELSVIYNRYLSRWIMTYGNGRGIVLRDSPSLTGPWSDEWLVVPNDNTGVYGAFMDPSLVRNDGQDVYFTMSRWQYYNVFLMKMRFTRKPNAVVGLRLTPARVASGGRVSGTVSLKYPAAPGTTVRLSCDQPAVLSFSPNSLHFPTGATTASFTATTASAVGPLTVRVTASDDADHSSATISLPVDLGPDAYEPDDVALAARRLLPGAAQRHSIHVPTDEDWAYFDLAHPSVVDVTTSGYRSADTEMWLYAGPGSPQVAYNDDSAGQHYARLVGLSLSAGRYFVRVRSWNRTSVIVEYLLGLGVQPIAPSGLTATAVSATLVNLAWTDTSGDEVGFRIERHAAGQSWVQIAVVGANGVTYRDTAVAPQTTYTYRVRAYNLSGFSGYSNEAAATTPAASGAPDPDAFEPDDAAAAARPLLAWAPQDHSIHATSDEDWTYFDLDRSAVVGVITSGDGSGDTELWLYAGPGTNQVGYNDDSAGQHYARLVGLSLAAGRYYVRVRSYNHASVIRQYTLTLRVQPAAPSDLRATAVSATEIDLSWTDHSTYESGFSVERSTGGGGWVTVAQVVPNAEGYRDTTVSPGTTYTYRVRALNPVAPSAYSNEATATTPARFFRVSGRVTFNDAQNPYAGVEVWVGGEHTVTAADGTYSLLLPAGRVIIEPRKAGIVFTPATTDLDLQADVSGVNFIGRPSVN